MKRRTRAIDGEALAAEIASLSKLVFANSASAGSHVRKSAAQGNRPARSDSRDRISPPGTGLQGTQAFTAQSANREKSYLPPSSDVDLASPVIACFVEV
jgi:hypothetical protein